MWTDWPVPAMQNGTTMAQGLGETLCRYPRKVKQGKEDSLEIEDFPSMFKVQSPALKTKLNIESSYNSVIPYPGTYPRRLKVCSHKILS